VWQKQAGLSGRRADVYLVGVLSFLLQDVSKDGGCFGSTAVLPVRHRGLTKRDETG
jgi:hypothetical protein